jgi:hypothetical protein
VNVGDAVLVTTEHRGVFFGFVREPLSADNRITLSEVQMAIYFANTRGVFGLASGGPNSDCRIGGPVPEITLVKVTAVALCTPEAVAQFKAAPWSA